jgi:diguanylate cyclase (GGDEF)-like protein
MKQTSSAELTTVNATLVDQDDILEFKDEGHAAATPLVKTSWTILVVDDDEDVHAATRFALLSANIFERSLNILHAHSAAEAQSILQKEKNIAVILLDVVMESNDAGLLLVKSIREDLNLQDVRIILRTGQPGYAPELEVINRYDINDYKTKAELTQTRLLTTLTAAIRSYRQIVAINESRRGLEMIIQAGADLLTRRGINHFAEGILTQVAALLSLPPEGMIVAENKSTGQSTKIVAAAGRFSLSIGLCVDELQDDSIRTILHEAFERGENIYGEDASVLFFGSATGQRVAAYIATHRSVEAHEKNLLRIFCQNIALASDNVSLVDRLHQLAYIDPLSQLPNRMGFIEIIEQLLAAGEENQAVAVLDIDHFSATSETIGYRDANKLLTQIGRRLRERLPAAVKIARVSGDAFALIGTANDLEATKLSAIFDEQIDVGGMALTLSATTGRVTLSTLVDSHGEDVLRSAFIALKRAKEQRRGSDYEFTPALAEKLRHRTSLLQDMREAIRNNEFSLVFQPQVDLVTEKPIGVEALIRWKKKNGDYVSPDRFIDVAEHSGVIVQLGEFVMDMACKELALLRNQGYTNLRMAINVSMMQWIDRGFPELVESMLQKYELPPQMVELEITESVAMQGAGPVQEVMLRLRKIGLQMALDDFGTGFSSLSYLQQLPVHRLKIDRAFVGGMEESNRNATLAETVIRLGQNLGLSVIAEGVENVSQANLLRTLGCQEAQGYYYARPMPSADLMSWLSKTTSN